MDENPSLASSKPIEQRVLHPSHLVRANSLTQQRGKGAEAGCTQSGWSGISSSTELLLRIPGEVFPRISQRVVPFPGAGTSGNATTDNSAGSESKMGGRVVRCKLHLGLDRGLRAKQQGLYLWHKAYAEWWRAPACEFHNLIAGKGSVTDGHVLSCSH